MNIGTQHILKMCFVGSPRKIHTFLPAREPIRDIEFEHKSENPFFTFFAISGVEASQCPSQVAS